MVGPCRVIMLKTPVRSVVSWQGSILANPDVGRGDKLVQTLAVRLLDKGTSLRNRFEIAETLENRGAQIHFLSDNLRVGFRGRALREDVPETVRIMAESLRMPLLSESEFKKVCSACETSVQHARTDTSAQASRALLSRMYRAEHPNFGRPPEETLERLRSLDVETVRDYHARHFGANEFLLVFVGDLDHEQIIGALEEAFGNWTANDNPAAYESEPEPDRPGKARVYIADRPNLDVRLGHGLRLDRWDPDFIPLYAGISILGGNFSARLMQKLREDLGLTYGIYARLAGIGPEYHGYAVVGVTLSQENLERGIRATLDEVCRFVEEGPTDEELARRKTTICGNYKVRLGTTSGLAATLYRYALYNLGVDYLELFPQEISALTLEGVNGALRRQLRPTAFHSAIAGTIPESVSRPV